MLLLLEITLLFESCYPLALRTSFSTFCRGDRFSPLPPRSPLYTESLFASLGAALGLMTESASIVTPLL